jgi:cation transport ATPase
MQGHTKISNSEISSGDGEVDYTVNIRVLGMMCQRNCGATVRQALEEIPGCVEATSSFENSYASITANLEIYGGVSNPNNGGIAFIFDARDTETVNNLRKKMADDAVEAIEDVGFEASILEPGQDLELRQEDSSENATILQNDRLAYSALEIEATTAKDYAKQCDDDVEAIVSLQVKGMSCAVCTGRVERAIKEVSGVKNATVSLPTSRANVQIMKDDMEIVGSDMPKETSVYDRIRLLAETCANAVTKAGYECEVLEVYNPSDGTGGGMSLSESAAKLAQARKEELNTWANLLIISGIFTTPLIILHYTSMMGATSDSWNDQKWKQWLSFYLATPVQFVVGKRFYIAAYHSFKNGRVMGMDFLICLGTTAAYLYSVIVLAIHSMGFVADAEQDG